MIELTVLGKIPFGLTDAHLSQAVEGAFTRARRSPRGAVSIRFVSETEMTKLNTRYRHKRRPTDVLSFSAQEGEGADIPLPASERLWGDIVIASQYAAREAKRRALSPAQEVIRLTVHGTLHLLGFDHATPPDEEKMFRMQEDVVEKVAGDI